MTSMKKRPNHTSIFHEQTWFAHAELIARSDSEFVERARFKSSDFITTPDDSMHNNWLRRLRCDFVDFVEEAS